MTHLMWNNRRRPEQRGLIPKRVPAPGQRPGKPRRNEGDLASGSREAPPATDSENGGVPPGADVVGLAAIWLEKRGVPRNGEEVTVAILRDAGS